jgi:hypothetical protein
MKERGFLLFWNTYGNQLLRGWLRARKDGNQEDFQNWVVGEYEFWQRDKNKADPYEVPYFGICDEPSPVEKYL